MFDSYNLFEIEERNINDIDYYHDYYFIFRPISIPMSPPYLFNDRESESDEREIINLKEIKSDNGNFMQDKNIKYTLYPLYINWKKIETKKSNNNYYNIFKLYGYFGVAVYNILTEVDKNCGEKYNHKNFIFDLGNTYLKHYEKPEIKENEFYKKLVNIYENVINLIKNKIFLFKEVSVFLIIMRLYENYFVTIDDNDKIFEVLKYQYIIMSYITENEYKKIYNKFYQKYNSQIYFSRRIYKCPESKQSFIRRIKKIYNEIKKKQEKKLH
jgi:hypothetical protein